MKREDNKNGKIASSLYYLASACFFIVAIINLAKSNTDIGVVFLCLGSTFLCFGSVYWGEDKEKDDKNEK